jgi:cation diffusion facilitator family transporter
MTMGLALIVILAGVGIFLGVAWHAWTNHSAFIAPSAITLWVAGLSVLVNESLFRYMKHVSERLQSKLLNVSAWHNRSDAASSLLVFISVILSIAGYRFVDVLAAAIIALFIIKMGWQFAWTSLQELVDTGLDESQLKQMEAKITEVSGVKSLHQLRTRSIGGDVFLDVHILVDAFISVSEGHFIGDQVMQALRKQFTFVKDVTVHVDPEDDLHHHRSSTLPNRQSLKPLINTACAGLPGAEHLSWRLHYLQGHIEIELLLPAEVIQDNVADIQAQYQQALSNITAIKTVHILLNIPGALT